MGGCVSRASKLEEHENIPWSSSARANILLGQVARPPSVPSSSYQFRIPISKPPETILGRPLENVKLYYTILEKELRRGDITVTYLCIENATGRKYACKSIPKSKLTDVDSEDIRREIQIMQHLSGQPNIVEFKGAYEDTESVHLVMELCEGGELFDHIVAKGHFTEKAAALIFRSIMNVVRFCHFMGVMHRDLKPENFLFSSKDRDALLKAADFGLSVFITDGKTYHDKVGSSFYMAPEVLKGSYGMKVDIWSAGVILYILLCGAPPFWGETDVEIFDAILKGNINFDRSPWPSISDNAKDLIKRMLTLDPEERITAAEVLEHPWIKNGEVSDQPIDNAVLARMKEFKAMNKLKKLALKIIAERLSEEEILGLKAMFTHMDTDNSGTITYDELKRGLTQLQSDIGDDEVQLLMKAVDMNGNGEIDYAEFITATMHRLTLEKEEYIYKTFQYLDKDRNGFITREELQAAVEKYGITDDATISIIISEVDADNDDRINYEEFYAAMKHGSLQNL